MVLSYEPPPRRRSRKGLYVTLAIVTLVVLALLWKHPWSGAHRRARFSQA